MFGSERHRHDMSVLSLQGTTVDDVPLLRVANRPSPASGLKAASSGSLAVALPDGRRRYKRPERLPSSHFGSVAFLFEFLSPANLGVPACGVM